MTYQDRSEFAALMARLSAAFGVTLKPERVAVYFDALADRPLDFTRRAVHAAIRNCLRFPSIAELRQIGRASAPAPEPPKVRDHRPVWEQIEAAARTDYQHALCRLMATTLTLPSLRERAKRWRAFGAEWGEREPWESMAVEAERRAEAGGAAIPRACVA